MLRAFAVTADHDVPMAVREQISAQGYRPSTSQVKRLVELKIPKLRKGSYFSGFLEPRWTAEGALTAVIQEAYIKGEAKRIPGRGDRRVAVRSGICPS